MRKEEFIKMIVNGDVDDTEEFWENIYDSIKKEHCNEPNCPECNLVAYEKGKQDVLQAVKEMVEKMKGYSSPDCSDPFLVEQGYEVALQNVQLKLDELMKY